LLFKTTSMSYFFFWWYQCLNSGLFGYLAGALCLNSPFCSGYFGNTVLFFSQAGLECYPSILHFRPLLEWQAHPIFSVEMRVLRTFFCPDLFGTKILLISISHVAEMTAVHHHTQLLVDMEPCPGYSQTVILLISASQVARIIDVSHCCLVLSYHLYMFQKL
jgi:hypothetical protein